MLNSQSTLYRYGIALFFVGAALVFSLIFHNAIPDAFLIFFLSAVMLSGWFGRTWAGLLAVFASMICVGYFFIQPYRAYAVDVDELPYLLSFLVSAVVTSWLGSARRAAEERQRAHLDELFEFAPEAILLVDLEDRVLRVNKEFTEIFGYTIDEILHKKSMDLLVPSQFKTDNLRLRERLARGHNVNVEAVAIRKDGSLVDVSEVAFPIVAEGKAIAYYVIFRDITEAKREREALQNAQADLARLSRITTMGEMAASIAHEINQPIGAIATNGAAAVRFLKQPAPDLGAVDEALDCIVRDANRAADVIVRIRSFLKKNPSPMSSLDMNEVIREVLALTAHEAATRHVTVASQLAESLPRVPGDRIQLQQVLLNLIMNALDAMNAIAERPRALHIQSSSDAESVFVKVLDSGNGWDPQHADAIFEPFFTTKKDGIGMGLTISRSIVEAHGGRLWGEPLEPYGAALTFTLPIAGTTQ